MNELEKIELLDEITLSQLGDYIVDYIYYWSNKLGIEEATLFKKLVNYIDITMSKKMVDDQFFFLDYKFRNFKENDWLEE